jgi:hypothetical protein
VGPGQARVAGRGIAMPPTVPGATAAPMGLAGAPVRGVGGPAPAAMMPSAATPQGTPLSRPCSR